MTLFGLVVPVWAIFLSPFFVVSVLMMVLGFNSRPAPHPFARLCRTCLEGNGNAANGCPPADGPGNSSHRLGNIDAELLHRFRDAQLSTAFQQREKIT